MARGYGSSSSGTYGAAEIINTDKQFGQFIESRKGQEEVSREVMAALDYQINKFGQGLEGDRTGKAFPAEFGDSTSFKVNVRPFSGQENSVKEIRAKYNENEDQNYHAENMVLMAKTVGSKEDVAQAESLLKRQNAAGELTPELGEERMKLYYKLNADWKKFLSTGEGGPKRGVYEITLNGLPKVNDLYEKAAAGDLGESLRDAFRRQAQLAIQEGRFTVKYKGA